MTPPEAPAAPPPEGQRQRPGRARSAAFAWQRAVLRKVAVGAALGLGLLTAQAQTKANCPPQAQPPTAAEMQAAAANARDRGLLWRITRDGRSSYLYGSIHLGKLDWAFPGPQVRAALMATDTVALEIDVGDPQMLARLKPPPEFVAPTLAPALRERLGRQSDAACIPREALAQLHPVMQAITLTVLAARWQGLDPGYGQELVLSGFARAGQRKVVSLESPELQMAVLIPREAEVAERMIGQMLDQLEQGKAQRVMARLADAWERGDVSEIGNYEAWCECVASEDEKAQMRRLNDDRNPALADGIAALHRDGRKVFAAVGSLHMTGPQGLPLLMQQRGFTVERVTLR